MVNPQKENGNTQIANELLDAIIARADLNATELACLFYIIRKTYGWNKKTDAISISQFVTATKRCRRAVCYALKRLRLLKIALVQDCALGSTVYGINKHFDEWLVQDCALVHKNARASAQTRKLLVQDCAHTKDTLTKDNIQKTHVADPQALTLSKILLDCILLHYKNFKHDAKTVERWARDIELLLRIDKRDPKEAEAVIRFAQSNSFWRRNVLSGEKLRKQYDRIFLEAKGEYEKQNEGRVYI